MRAPALGQFPGIIFPKLVAGIAVLSLGTFMLGATEESRVPDSHDERVAEDFKKFAAEEVVRLKARWQGLQGQFLGDVKGKAMPWPLRKFLFSGTKLESVPDGYSIDARHTDSIISPYIGTIEYPIVLINASVFVKGRRQYCIDQPIQTCLSHGGEVFESDVIYHSFVQRHAQNIKLEYVYRDGQWKPTHTLEELVRALSPFAAPPPDAATVLGAPSDPQPDDTMITYIVSGTACAADLHYRLPSGAVDEVNAPMGWTRTFRVKDGQPLFLQAKNRCDAGSVTSTIKKGNKVLKTVTETGPHASAFASLGN